MSGDGKSADWMEKVSDEQIFDLIQVENEPIEAQCLFKTRAYSAVRGEYPGGVFSHRYDLRLRFLRAARAAASVRHPSEIRTLNVAGPRASKEPGGEFVMGVLEEAFLP